MLLLIRENYLVFVLCTRKVSFLVVVVVGLFVNVPTYGAVMHRKVWSIQLSYKERLDTPKLYIYIIPDRSSVYLPLGLFVCLSLCLYVCR